MIKLENVSKFYYSKGLIATGFSKVNLEFKMGEFIAITGESGSGKSTLLNVISGLDTYEEGEMYINGEETSHYTEKDFEEYRRKYIGNIYQNFNLINSYSVYQNIELVMILNGCQHFEIKDKINELIDKVGLSEYRNTKVSKLSGGQKQRVSIARALAKETPIIIADEPTGNLDIKSANEIFALLHEISKDKLVVVVTHNYEQVEPYVTRKIRMHDGKILEDLVVRQEEKAEEKPSVDYLPITAVNTVRLGFRNTFNLVPKFLLLLAVFLFIALSLMSEYSYFKKSQYLNSISGYNYVFHDSDPKRIIINKNDGYSITDDDYENISHIKHVDSIVHADLTLDMETQFSNDSDIWYYGTIHSVDALKEEDLVYGHLPENDNEIVVQGNENNYGYSESFLESVIYRYDESTYEIDKTKEYKVVGIVLNEDVDDWSSKIYADNATFNDFLYSINQQYSKLSINFLGHIFESKKYTNDEITSGYALRPYSKVPKGNVWISNNFNEYAPGKKAIGQVFSITVSNLYYCDTIGFNVGATFNESNCKKLLTIEPKNIDHGRIYVNPEDYEVLFNKSPHQSSVIVDDPHNVEEVAMQLQGYGYHTLAMKDALVSYQETEILQVIRAIVTVALVIVLFFISYFVVRIIFKSRNVYFAIIRMLGASQKVAENLLIFELVVVANIAELIALVFVLLQKFGILNIDLFDTMLQYLTPMNYLIMYLLPIVMAILIGIRYSNKLFKNSAMVTIKEEQ